MTHIIYIGEDPEVIRLFSGRQDVEFKTVRNAVQFDKFFNQNNMQPDLILCEKTLKGMNGFELFNYYKNILKEKGIPYVLVDQHFGNYTKRLYLKEKVTDIYQKPLDPQMVIERIPFLKNIEESRKNKLVKLSQKPYRIPLAKRIFDIVFASVALIVVSPILLVAAIAIKLESPGPIFYKSKRVGTGYRIFDFYKLRSMYTDADRRLKEYLHMNQYKTDSTQTTLNDNLPKQPKSKFASSVVLIHKDGTPLTEEEYKELKKQMSAGTFFKLKDDPRVTKVGAFLRNTSIDELPQLINVLKGDMSIVGNRPLPLYEAEQLTSDDWSERFLAPAGITGLWQVEKRGKSDMSEEERKALDNQYARNFSFWNDIKIILKTIPALFQKENV
ncbi:glycosyl transferase [Schleiferia thermophila str. Yellowstone]|jgi:lipopolysaccharide/colanic/teichoic acid biosynthesis glycosyltransferase|uniref:sugar transferase n=1 Tax=Schleiferia thermophila TaxID=884107 RepID=UPI0004E7ADF1|nr:sugar transferase [Schleiferia thermophila]KFD39744.1 glycosyl transferase [Schleiferia thermophila str. Yellowstone]